VSLLDATKRKEEFVRGAGQSDVEPSIQRAVDTAKRMPVGTGKKKATFNLDADLHQRLKVAAAVHRREMVDLVEEALTGYLEGLEEARV
jgi:hypothetical protein